METQAERTAMLATDGALDRAIRERIDALLDERLGAKLAEIKAVRQGTLPIGIVAMRVDMRTHSATELDAFLQAIEPGTILETVRTGASGIGRGERILRV